MNHDDRKPKKKLAAKKTPDSEVINVDAGEKIKCKVFRDALEKAIRQQFKKRKTKQMTEYIDATPVFEPKQFVKVFIYHLLWIALGPFSAIIIRCFEPTVYIKNLGFLPSCGDIRAFFIIQMTLWIPMVVAVGIYVMEWYKASDSQEEVGLNAYPLYYLGLSIFSRYVIIASRAGTTPVS